MHIHAPWQHSLALVSPWHNVSYQEGIGLKAV